MASPGAARLGLEALEDRRVPAILFDAPTGTLTLVGTDNANTIRLDKSGADTLAYVVINGSSETATFAPGAVKHVNVFAGAGDDHVTIFAGNGFPVYVHGESGFDNVYVNLSQVGGFVFVDGGGDSQDRLETVDYQNDADTTYSVSDSLIGRTIQSTQATSSVQYQGFNRVIVQGGEGNNDFTLDSAAQNTRMFLYGGSGSDSFGISPSARNLDTVGPSTSITIYGGGGGLDNVIAYDDANPLAVTYGFREENSFDDVLSRAKGSSSIPDVEITYTSIDYITVLGGSAGNVWNLDDVRVETYLGGGAGSRPVPGRRGSRDAEPQRLPGHQRRRRQRLRLRGPVRRRQQPRHDVHPDQYGAEAPVERHGHRGRHVSTWASRTWTSSAARPTTPTTFRAPRPRWRCGPAPATTSSSPAATTPSRPSPARYPCSAAAATTPSTTTTNTTTPRRHTP